MNGTTDYSVGPRRDRTPACLNSLSIARTSTGSLGILETHTPTNGPELLPSAYCTRCIAGCKVLRRPPCLELLLGGTLLRSRLAIVSGSGSLLSGKNSPGGGKIDRSGIRFVGQRASEPGSRRSSSPEEVACRVFDGPPCGVRCLGLQLFMISRDGEPLEPPVIEGPSDVTGHERGVLRSARCR